MKYHFLKFYDGFAQCRCIFLCYELCSAVPTPVNPADLKLLSSIEVVTGYVYIQMDKVHNFFTDYSFLGNLRVIHGRYLSNGLALDLYDASLLTVSVAFIAV